LALGTEVAVPTLTGKINLKVPAGSQNGQRMRAKGHGLQSKAGERGYLFVQLKAVMPKKSDDEIKALWQELAKKPRSTREKTSDPRPGVARNEQPSDRSTGPGRIL
jgi:DnaJ-class molecular chaperone